MEVSIKVNNTTIKTRKDTTILEALRENGIQIPTLCRLEDFTPTGACRLCVVEVEGMDKLVTACSYPVEQGMVIKTHSQRVIEARKMIVELLLSNHPDDCLYCENNGNCELQRLASELNIRDRRISGRKMQAKLDLSSPGIVFDRSKCILCGRCVRICEEVVGVCALDFISRGNDTTIGTAMGKDINFSSCIQCGQCVLSCPTGAIHEKSYFDVVQESLNKPEVKVVAHYSPSVAITLAEEFGIRSGKDVSGLLNAALRKIGFEKIFDGSFGSDLHIMEEAALLEQRIDEEEDLPMLSSSCSAFVKYMEQFHPDMLHLLSTVKSPEQITGSVIKQYCLESKERSRNDIFSVAIVPCPAKKYEAQRQEMTHKGISDIDAVLTTREISRLIRLYGIDIEKIEPEETDVPFKNSSSAGKLMASLGGQSESVLRTLYYNITGYDLVNPKISKLRGTKNTKQAKIKVNDNHVNVLSISPLGKFDELVEEIRKGKNKYQYIEVMTCPGGCINGGGQPAVEEDKTIKNRIKAIQSMDEKNTSRFAHKNPTVKEFYSKYFNQPLSHEAQEKLHTSYTPKDVLL
jgi:NADH-quinone oxidoreductase subunit G/NADP-reducing hydrogenase subunit HndD